MGWVAWLHVVCVALTYYMTCGVRLLLAVLLCHSCFVLAGCLLVDTCLAAAQCCLLHERGAG
jgi:hypothetical protein